MRTRAGLSSKNSDYEVFTTQTEDFFPVLFCVMVQKYTNSHQTLQLHSKSDLYLNYRKNISTVLNCFSF